MITATRTKSTLIVLTGATGSGKDTLAAKLVEDYGYKRLAFGDFLRQDVIDAYGPPASTDERSVDCYPAAGKSFKDAMLILGAQIAIEDPCRYSRLLCLKLDKLLLEPRRLVVTDCRKPIEFESLRSYVAEHNKGDKPGLASYFYKIVREQNPYKPQRLDGVLQPEQLAKLNGILYNRHGFKDSMLNDLRNGMELSLPYVGEAGRL